MSDESDLDLYQAPGSGLRPDPPIPPPATPLSPWPVLIVVALMLIATVAFFVTRRRAEPEAPAPTAAVTPGPPPPSSTRSSRPTDTTLPPLSESDAAVRDILGGLSQHPVVTAWLSGNDLLRSAAAAIAGVAEGKSPAAQLRRLAPAGAFSVRASGGRTVIDPESYRRYDAVAAAIDSVDPVAAARVYRTLAPRLDEAFKELGVAGTLDETVQRAAHQVLTAPAVDGEIPVVQTGLVYAYADPGIEDLSPVAKLLVRMGPENVRRIQAKVRDLLGELRRTS